MSAASRRLAARHRELRRLLGGLVLSAASPAALWCCSGGDRVNPLPVPGDATLEARAPASAEASPDAPVDGVPADGLPPDSGASRPDAADGAPAEGGGDAGDAGPDAADADAAHERGRDAEGDAPSFYCDDASVGAPYFTKSGGKCAYYRDLSCAAFPHIKNNCYLGLHDCDRLCDLADAGLVFNCSYTMESCVQDGLWIVEAGAPVTVECAVCPNAGRRPAGLRRAPRGSARDVVGAHFAVMARLEAASVRAFRRLSRELAHHGAPVALVRAADRAARDEIRHARDVGRLAARRGEPAAPVGALPRGLRALEPVALENGVEGCVRETYGALVALWQAERAEDPAVGLVLARVARDEVRHAALAWEIDRWATGRLDARARERVRRARARSVATLRREVRRAPPAALIRAAGQPRAAEAATLLERMLAHLGLATSA